MFAFLLIYILMFYTMPKPPYNWLPNYSLMLLCVIKSKHLYMYILHYFVSPGIMAILILNKFGCSFVHKSVDDILLSVTSWVVEEREALSPSPKNKLCLYIYQLTLFGWCDWLGWFVYEPQPIGIIPCRFDILFRRSKGHGQSMWPSEGFVTKCLMTISC